MASPLSDARDTKLNADQGSMLDTLDCKVTQTSQIGATDLRNDTPRSFCSSPSSSSSSSSFSSSTSFFVPTKSDSIHDAEIVSTDKSPSRLLTNSAVVERVSTLNMLKSCSVPPEKASHMVRSPRKLSSAEKPSDMLRSPRKLSSAEKRFPVKPSSPLKESTTERTLQIEHILRDNEALTKAIEILEDEDSDTDEEHAMENTVANLEGESSSDDIYPNVDDTIISTCSTFSAVPDMTMFTKLGSSRTKVISANPTPRRNTMTTTPSTNSKRPMDPQSPSNTPRDPRYKRSRDEGNTTNLLLDFTEQFHEFADRSSPAKLARQSALMSSANVPSQSWASTPSTHRHSHTISTLLDFDIPPAPTPRSMPTITPRELESLKSGLLCEISSLKASLSGREAEILSLKAAVSDAEKRVGQSMEQIREERSFKEQLAADKEDWEKRGRDMESVLRNVREEIVEGERERDELEGRLEESEARRQAAEIMAQEAETKMAAMKAGKPPSVPEISNKKLEDCVCGGKPVEMAVEKVSRELHTLYKEKHEAKVSALKKSYERRWEKKARELESRVDDLVKENEELKLGRDTTITEIKHRNPMELTSGIVEVQAACDAKIKELEAEVDGLSGVVQRVENDNTKLCKLLDDERVEKGRLVQSVEEMIPLVASFDDLLASMESPVTATVCPKCSTTGVTTPALAPVPHHVENLRSSISRASGLRAPTSVAMGESRIGRGGLPTSTLLVKSRSGSQPQSARPVSGLGYRSGIMSSIEKMGNYKGRLEH